MIKNVVFDLGRVMYTFFPMEDLQGLGLPESSIARIMDRVYNNPTWRDADRGITTVAAHLAQIRADYPDMAEDMQTVFGDGWIDRLIKIMPDSLDFFNDVKKRGFGIYVITDFAADTFAHCRARDAFFNEADGIVVSAHEKLLKPDPAIFKCLLDRYKLTAEECVFIDDLEPNITAAKSVGMHGIQFTGAEACRKDFEELIK